MQKAPKESLEVFTAESKVKMMIKDAVQPIHVRLPALSAEMKHIRAELSAVKVVQKKQATEIALFRDGMAALRENERIVKGFEQTFLTKNLQVQEHMVKQDTATERFTGRFEELYKRLRDDKKTLDRRFAVFEQNYNTIDSA